MPKANDAGDKPVKAVKTKAKPAAESKGSKAAQTTKTTTAAKPKVSDKPVARQATTKKSPAPRKPAKQASGEGVPALSDEQRRHYVEVAAYYIAERRGFCGSQLEDWVQAETEIERLLREGILKP